MLIRHFINVVPAIICVLAVTSARAGGQVLYSQNFDADDTANWTVVDGPTVESADFFFDYSTVGIPPAPTFSGSGTTRGMKLQANVPFDDGDFDAFGGFNVSPTGQSFTGDYTLKFDWWSNYNGPLDTGAAGSTMLSTFGVLTSGTAGNFPSDQTAWPQGAVADGVYFATTGDGGSTFDYRAYSVERATGYLASHIVPNDAHAVYVAGIQNNSAAYYTSHFPGGYAAPAIQQAMYPLMQTGTTPAGSQGFTWHQVAIEKTGPLVVWYVDDVLIVTVDTTDFAVPTGGNNIFFGHSDVNSTTGIDEAYWELNFTLIDNIRVISHPSCPGDLNGDGYRDLPDFALFSSAWLSVAGQPKYNPAADLHGDKTVNLTDLVLFCNGWLLPCPEN